MDYSQAKQDASNQQMGAVPGLNQGTGVLSRGALVGQQGDQLQIGRQEKELSNLFETVKTLKGRLTHVLSPETTVNDVLNENAERPQLSPLAERVGANNRIIAQTNAQLEDIIRRLEC